MNGSDTSITGYPASIERKTIPPIMQHTIRLDGLTPDEERIIKEVLGRDAKVAETLDARISSVRKDIQNIRKQGALAEKDDLNTMCARCKEKFWTLPVPFTDRGYRCIRCKFRVCRRCRVRQVNKTWLCSLCLKLRQVKLLTGEWMGIGLDSGGLYGSDLVRASFRDRDLHQAEPGVTEEERTEIRCPTPQYVVTKAALHKGAETASRTSVNSRSSEDTITGQDDQSAKDVQQRQQKPGKDGPVSESLRDSDSGVTSSGRASQVTTPEQRSLSNEKGDSHPGYAATDKSSVPVIAVTEEAGEEDDDLDELFSKHRNDSSLLGSRSSLRDSRESLYSVYSNAEENYGNVPVSGEILFHLTYDYKSNVLSVHIKQCKDISPVDTKHNRSDPYVKTYLLPDKTRGSKRKSKIKRHTLNPVFDEVLKYSVSKAELDSRTLWVSVWNNDRFGRNDFLGEITIPLAYYKFDHSAPIWYLLQERAAPEDTSLMTYKGDLYISIKYVPANMVDSRKKVSASRKSKSKSKVETSGLGEVHVLVKEAKNLTAMRGSGGSNPFCKGYLLPDKSHNSKQKTPVIKKNTNPEWQHILVFEGADENQLEQQGLELTIWDYEKLSSNDFLGGVRLNLGLGTSKGKPADWMDAKGEEIEIWQAMMETPNEWVDAQLPLRSSMGAQNMRK